MDAAMHLDAEGKGAAAPVAEPRSQADRSRSVVDGDLERRRNLHELYVDISTPAQWDGDTVRLIDLDLDVARRRGGGVEIHDQDEFEDHQVLYGYPDHIIDKVRTETARIAAAVEARADPFGAVAEAWLDTAHDH